MAKFKDLDISDEPIGGEEKSYDEAPEERSFEPPLPEGPYLFELPPRDVLAEGISTMTATIDGKEVQRVYIVFGAACPLTVVDAKAGEEFVGRVWRGLINNRERNRARKGQPVSLWSDWDFMLRALGEKEKPKNNMEYINKLLAHAGEQFVADNEYSVFCNDRKVKYIQSDEGPNIPDPNGGFGCGRNYYSRDIDVIGGKKVTSFLCKNPECGASLLVNNNLVRFRPAPSEED